MARQLQKMANLDYHYSVLEMAAAAGGRLDKVYEIEDGLYRLRISKEGKKFDVIARLGSSMHLTNLVPESPMQPTPFASLLRKHLDNAVVESVEQVSFDRLIRLRLHRDRPLQVYFEMFAKGNLVLCDAENTVLAAYREQRESKRIVQKGKPYPLPPKPAQALFETGGLTHFAGGKTPAEAVREASGLAPSYFEDFLRSGRARSAESAGEIAKALEKYVSSSSPTVYYSDGGAVGFSCVRLEAPEKFLKVEPPASVRSSKGFGTLFEALDEYYSNAVVEAVKRPEKNARLEKLEHQRAMQSRTVEEARKEADALRAAGDAIYLNFEKAQGSIEQAKKDGKKSAEIEV